MSFIFKKITGIPIGLTKGCCYRPGTRGAGQNQLHPFPPGVLQLSGHNWRKPEAASHPFPLNVPLSSGRQSCPATQIISGTQKSGAICPAGASFSPGTQRFLPLQHKQLHHTMRLKLSFFAST
jgi:hypothetical protein